MTDILLRNKDGEHTILKSKSFDKEKLLHDALEESPSLLSLEEHVEDVEMVPIGREVSVSSGSADMLYLDNQGVLNLVEVKLDSNREVRRNVVGQILEYASQMINWSYGDLEDRFASYEGSDGSKLFSYFTEETGGVDEDEAEFRDLVENNLQDGQIRLIVAVNNMVKPLKDIITFLNDYTTFEIYGLQIDQYEENGMSVYVPRLFGYKSESSKGTSNRKRWDENSFFEDVRERIPEEEEKMRKLFNLVDPENHQTKSNIRADEISWGTGSRRGSFNPKYYPIGEKSLFSVYSDGEININIGWHEDVDGLDQLLRDLEESLEEVSIDQGSAKHNVNFHISDLTENFEGFRDAVEETVNSYRK